jgi:uncharacterized protein (TIGR02466 family)
MNPQAITLHRADLFLDNVGTVDQRQQLTREIKDIQIKHPDGTARTNLGCWRWNRPSVDIKWLMPNIMKMLDNAVKFYNSEDEVFSNMHELDLVQIDYWANINQSGSRNTLHNHKSAQFSAVYYLQAEDTGGLMFYNSADIMSDCNAGSPFVRQYRVNPKDGDLLLWPSWVPHEVETNFSDKERINLAFDIKIKY